MSAMMVLRLDGEDDFLLVDPDSGTVREIDAEDVPALEMASVTSTRYAGVAEAYALPAMPSLPSRKFFRH